MLEKELSSEREQTRRVAEVSLRTAEGKGLCLAC